MVQGILVPCKMKEAQPILYLPANAAIKQGQDSRNSYLKAEQSLEKNEDQEEYKNSKYH